MNKTITTTLGVLALTVALTACNNTSDCDSSGRLDGATTMSMVERPSGGTSGGFRGGSSGGSGSRSGGSTSGGLGKSTGGKGTGSGHSGGSSGGSSGGHVKIDDDFYEDCDD